MDLATLDSIVSRTERRSRELDWFGGRLLELRFCQRMDDCQFDHYIQFADEQTTIPHGFLGLGKMGEWLIDLGRQRHEFLTWFTHYRSARLATQKGTILLWSSICSFGKEVDHARNKAEQFAIFLEGSFTFLCLCQDNPHLGQAKTFWHGSNFFPSFCKIF